MRKSGKKLLSLMTVGLLMFQTFSIPSGSILAQSSDQTAAQEDSGSNVVDSGVCGDNLTWTLDSDGVLYISGTGEMYDQETPWKSDSVYSCIIDYGVTSIGWIAFSECSNLTNIKIPDSITSIGSYSFDGCSSLTNIEIPMSVTTIGDSAFRGCSSLIEISVDNANASYYSLDGVLYTKDMKTLVAYPAGKTNKIFEIPSGVTWIADYAFNSCSSLTSIDIPASVTTIGDYAFSDCISLTNIELPASVPTLSWIQIPVRL